MLLDAYKKCDFMHLSCRLLFSDVCAEGLHNAHKVTEALCERQKLVSATAGLRHKALHKAEAYPVRLSRDARR